MAAALRPLPRMLRGVFAGAGSDGLNEPAVCAEVLALTGKPASAVTLGYLGTATYDLDGPMKRQTGWFAANGCTVVPIRVGAQERLSPDDGLAAVAALKAVDVVLVSGGNTLYAMDRWRASGVADALRECAERGVVLCGGSAGAICWFDGGHSDSFDADTFRQAMIDAASTSANKDESSAAPARAEDRKPWRYIRVSCLGFLPGLVCPHHDKTQSNGVPRADDFDAMLRRHRGERGVCIDHWAALVVDGDRYRVLSLDGKPGSVAGCAANDMANVGAATYAPNQGGVPGVWVKECQDATATDDGVAPAPVASVLAPWSGALSDLLREPRPAVGINVDPAEEDCRRANPAV